MHSECSRQAKKPPSACHACGGVVLAETPIELAELSSLHSIFKNMKLALELEFPDAQAANVLRLLQSVPDVTARILPHPASASAATSTETELSSAERARLFEEFAGSWQSEEDGTELARQLQEARYFRDREVNL